MVAAIDRISRVFGFAVPEGPGFLVDWGTRDVGSSDSERALIHIKSLIYPYAPDTVVVEEVADPTARRRGRTREWIEATTRVCGACGLGVAMVSVTRIHHMFRDAEANTTFRIAHTIADHFPELAPRLPPSRKRWMSGDARMSIFDAGPLP